MSKVVLNLRESNFLSADVRWPLGDLVAMASWFTKKRFSGGLLGLSSILCILLRVLRPPKAVYRFSFFQSNSLVYATLRNGFLVRQKDSQWACFKFVDLLILFDVIFKSVWRVCFLYISIVSFFRVLSGLLKCDGYTRKAFSMNNFLTKYIFSFISL